MVFIEIILFFFNFDYPTYGISYNEVSRTMTWEGEEGGKEFFAPQLIKDSVKIKKLSVCTSVIISSPMKIMMNDTYQEEIKQR